MIFATQASGMRTKVGLAVPHGTLPGLRGLVRGRKRTPGSKEGSVARHRPAQGWTVDAARCDGTCTPMR